MGLQPVLALALALTACAELEVWEFGSEEGGHFNGHCSPTTKFPNPWGAPLARCDGPQLAGGGGLGTPALECLNTALLSSGDCSHWIGFSILKTRTVRSYLDNVNTHLGLELWRHIYGM